MTDRGIALASLWASIAGSVATVAALAVAIWFGLHEVRAFRADARRRDEDRREEEKRQRRAQAEAVSAQAFVHASPSLEGDVFHRPRHAAYCEIVNASQLPIYNASVTFPNPEKPDETLTHDGIFVPGGGKGQVHLPGQIDRSLAGEPLELFFRDAAGNSWHRLTDGELHELAVCEDPGHTPPERTGPSNGRLRPTRGSGSQPSAPGR